MTFWHYLIVWVLAICIPAYLISMIWLVWRVRKEQKQFWKDIGSPSMTDMFGQMTIMRSLLHSDDLQKAFGSRYRTHVLITRALYSIGTGCFFITIGMAIGQEIR